MEKTARTLALDALYRMEIDGQKVEEVLKRSLDTLGGNHREKALAMELCYGVLRWRLKLDHALGQFYKGRLESLSPRIRNILRLGAYQIVFLCRVPQWAAVDESVKLARRYGHEGTARLVNGVLRSMCRDKARISYPAFSESALRYITVEHSHPEWLVKRWLKRFGVEKTISICQANNQIPPLTVRANTLKISPHRLAVRLRNEGLRAVPSKYAQNGLKLHGCGAPGELGAFKSGLLQVQDEASMLATQLLSPREGMKILDCCAGVGGKATLVAEIMRDSGFVLALDISHRRLSLLRDNCRRLGIHAVHAAAMDTAHRTGLRGFFDAVLVDAPCSNLGVLHRHPEVKWRLKEEDLLRLQGLQLQILENVWQFLRPGGVLVYSTCTVEPEENQEVMNIFLSSHKEFIMENAAPFLPPEAKKFVSHEGYFTTFPEREDMDGFFAVRVRRC